VEALLKIKGFVKGPQQHTSEKTLSNVNKEHADCETRSDVNIRSVVQERITRRVKRVEPSTTESQQLTHSFALNNIEIDKREMEKRRVPRDRSSGGVQDGGRREVRYPEVMWTPWMPSDGRERLRGKIFLLASPAIHTMDEDDKYGRRHVTHRVLTSHALPL
jgi:hypothetical protein